MSHIFISYAHVDGDFANTVIREIDKAGFVGWIDSEQLRAGQDWRQAIDDAIQNALALIVIMTPEAKASEYVTYEWACAVGAGVRVIPILLTPTQLHPRLETLQYLNFTDHTKRPWDKLFQELQEIRENTYTALRVPRGAPPFIRRASEDLDSYNPSVRKAAIDSLAENAHPIAIQVLQSATQHSQPDVRKAVMLKLIPLGLAVDKRYASSLTEAFDEIEPVTRCELLEKIGELQDSAFLPLLHNALQDTNERICVAAAQAIGAVGNEQSIPELINTLRSKKYAVRAAALNALGYFSTPEVVEILTKSVGDTNEKVRMAAAQALTRACVPEFIDQLYKLLDDPKQAGRFEIAAALTSASDDYPRLFNALGGFSVQKRLAIIKRGQWLPEAIPTLLPILHDHDLGELAAEALAVIGSPAVPDLLKIASGSDREACHLALSALGKIGDDSVVPDLIQIMNGDDRESVCVAAARSLQAIGGKKAEEALNKAISQHRYNEVREAAVRVKLSDPSPKAEKSKKIAKPQYRFEGMSLPELIKLTNHIEYEVRRAAVLTLNTVQLSDMVVETLIHTLQDKHPDVCYAAVSVLVKKKAVQAVPLLIPLLAKRDNPMWTSKRYCDFAADALTGLDTPEALAAVEKWRREQGQA